MVESQQTENNTSWLKEEDLHKSLKKTCCNDEHHN